MLGETVNCCLCYKCGCVPTLSSRVRLVYMLRQHIILWCWLLFTQYQMLLLLLLYHYLSECVCDSNAPLSSPCTGCECDCLSHLRGRYLNDHMHKTIEKAKFDHLPRQKPLNEERHQILHIQLGCVTDAYPHANCPDPCRNFISLSRVNLRTPGLAIFSYFLCYIRRLQQRRPRILTRT